MATFDRRDTWFELLRLWLVTLATNLIGGWVTIGLVVVVLPELSHVLVDLSHHFREIGLI